MDVLLAHQALAEPVRLELVQALMSRDLSPGEVADRWQLSTSLVAHHVKCLVDAGLIRRGRSEHDARKSYLSLRSDDPQVFAIASVGTPLMVSPARVAFVCTRNSARSKLAAAYWRRISDIPVVDAGTHPGVAPHPLAVEAARARGLELDTTMHDASTTLETSDMVIAVCDHAHETMAARSDRFHWSIPDPVVPADPSSFRRTCDDIESRVTRLQLSVRAPRRHA